jgi:hypothetical protein
MKLRILIAGSALFLASLAIAQTTVTPPPRPKGGPTLAATMQFIEADIATHGTVVFYAMYDDADAGTEKTVVYQNELSDVAADPGQCRIYFHYKMTQADGTIKSGDSWFPLRDVQRITVRSYEDYRNDDFARTGHSNLSIRATAPAMTIVQVYRPNAQKFFLFENAEIADRVARNLNRAIELCGGGN